MRLLNDEEINAVLDDWGKHPEGRDYSEEVAKAQHQLDLKEFIKWGNEECDEHPYTSRAKGEMYKRKHHRCPECWGNLSSS